METTSVTSKRQVTIPKELSATTRHPAGQPDRVLAGRRSRRDAGPQFARGRGSQRVRHAQEPACHRADGLRCRHGAIARAQAMIGLDINVLARYYIDDEADAEAQRQRLAARRLIESGQTLMVSKSPGGTVAGGGAPGCPHHAPVGDGRSGSGRSRDGRLSGAACRCARLLHRT